MSPHAATVPDPYEYYNSRGRPHAPLPHYASTGPHAQPSGYHPHPLPLPPLRSSHQYRAGAVFANAASGSSGPNVYPVAGSVRSVSGPGSRTASAHGSPRFQHSHAVDLNEEESDGCGGLDTDEDEEQPVLAGRQPPQVQSASAVNGREKVHGHTDATDDRGNLASSAWLMNALGANKNNVSQPPPRSHSAVYPPNDDRDTVQPPHAAGSLSLAAAARSYAITGQAHVPASASANGSWVGHARGAGGNAPPGPRFGFDGPAGYLGFDHLFPGGNPLLRRRDYFVFTAITYELMVRAIRVDRNLPEYPEGIEHAISSSVSLTAAHHPAGLTRKKWIRLKGRLDMDADRDARRCLTWKGCPLVIVPEDDWAGVVKSVHVLTDQPGIHASQKLTYALIRKQYQTRRSRCGIPQDVITDFCAMCAGCASGVFITDTCPESARNGGADQGNDQGSDEVESGASDGDDDDNGEGGSAARPKQPKNPAEVSWVSRVTLPTRGRPGKRKVAAAVASAMAAIIGGAAVAEQGESSDSRPTKRQRMDSNNEDTVLEGDPDEGLAESTSSTGRRDSPVPPQ